MQKIIIGSFAGTHGVRGWLKVMSATEPHDNIFNYSPWYVQMGHSWRELKLEQKQRHGKALLVKLAGIDDCDGARQLFAKAIGTDELPPLPTGEYYWHDLIGLRVGNLAGVDFGSIVELIETGAHDVLKVCDARGKVRLISYTAQSVRAVDLTAGTMLVDWGADWDD